MEGTKQSRAEQKGRPVSSQVIRELLVWESQGMRQTRQGFTDHANNFAFYPKSHGETLRDAKEGRDVIRFTF